MQIRTGTMFLAALLLFSTGCARRCYLKPDEQVHFFPSYAYHPAGKPDWNLVMQGRVVHPDSKSIFSGASMKALNSLAMLLPDIGRPLLLLEDKLKPFAMEGRGDTTVPVDLKGKTRELAKSAPDGYFQDEITLPAADVTPNTSWIDYQTGACKDDTRRFGGRALIIPETGTSVISDLNGTVQEPPKDSPAPFSLAFLAEYQVVPGMANRYSQWAAQGALFHYVSASPWQWLTRIQNFLGNNRFPAGTLHLQKVSLSNASDSLPSALETLARLVHPSTAHLSPEAENLLQRFPQRQFILIGNSGGDDAAVYAALARNHPSQIRAIYIRQLPGDESVKHWQDIFQGLPPTLWKVFSDPRQLPAGPDVTSR